MRRRRPVRPRVQAVAERRVVAGIYQAFEGRPAPALLAALDNEVPPDSGDPVQLALSVRRDSNFRDKVLMVPSAAIKIHQRVNGRTVEITIVGQVVAPVQRSGRTIRFRIKDVEGSSTVRLPVTYTGSVPDMFKVGRDISLKGRLRDGTFVGAPGTLVTKCPSKYSSKKET